MARATIALQSLVPATPVTPTFTTIVAGDDAQYDNTSGKVLLAFRNTDSGSATATIVSVACSHGRTGDVTVTVPAAAAGVPGEKICGPFDPALFNQTGGLVHVDTAAATVSMAAIKLP